MLVVVRREPDPTPHLYRVYAVHLRTGWIAFAAGADLTAVETMVREYGVAVAGNDHEGWHAARRKPVAYLMSGRRSRIW